MIRLLLILCLQHFIHPLKALSSPNAPKGSRGAEVWKPPSQNVAQHRGKIFDIQSPEDLLHFTIEDDRLAVVKVYASWCATCKKFDVRYRKIANQYGDTHDDTGGMQISQRVRFAEMQYDNPANRELCQDLLNVTTFPYILLYKGRKGKVDEFHCSPAKFQRLVDAVKEHLEIEEEGEEGGKREVSSERRSGIHHYPKYYEH